MSNIAVTNAQVPAHIASRVAKGSSLSQTLAGGLSMGPSYPRISIKASRFRIIDGQREEILPVTTLRAVIVGASPNVTKLFYAKKWNPNEDSEGPDCYSMDSIRPAKDARNPQSQLCAACPQNVWGSKVNELGNKIKACSDNKRLAVVSADDPNGPVYLLQVTPGALAGLASYSKMLASKGFPPELVVTNISFDPKESYPKLTFSFGGWVPEEFVSVIDELTQSTIVSEIVGDAPQQAVVDVNPALPPAQTLQATPAAEPITREEVVIDIPEIEPPPAKTTARGFGAGAEPAKAEPPTNGFGKRVEKEPQGRAETTTAAALTDDIRKMLDDL